MASATSQDGVDSTDSPAPRPEVTNHKSSGSASSSANRSCSDSSAGSSGYESVHSEIPSDAESDVWQSCEENSCDETSHDDLYSQDYFPDALKVRELFKSVERVKPLTSEDAVTRNDSQSPNSPPFQASNEYEAIEANARNWNKVLERLVANAPQPSSSHRSIMDSAYVEDIDQIHVRDFAEPTSLHIQRSDIERNQLEGLGSPRTPVHTTKLSDSGDRQNVEQEHSRHRPPPAFLTTLLDKAEMELLADISKLPYQKKEILRKPAVTDKYFPLEVYKKMCRYPELVKGFESIRALENNAMSQRLSITVMAARTGRASPNMTGHDPEPPVQSSAPDSSNSPPPENRPPHAANNDASSMLQPQSGTSLLPTSTYEKARVSPLPRAVDLLRNNDDPATPNPSPALSNDAGESLGNLTQLTERLEIIHDQTDDAGVVPQTRFASPAVCGGGESLLMQVHVSQSSKLTVSRKCREARKCREPPNTQFPYN
jgi:hypothetical protein